MTKTRRQNYTIQTCDHCGTIFQTARSHARYCGGTCRKAAQRERIRDADNSHNANEKSQKNAPYAQRGRGVSVLSADQLKRVYDKVRQL